MEYTLSPADIEEFRAIWREEFNEELPPEQARGEAERLLSVVFDIVSWSQRPERPSSAP